jgi:Sulfotransferase family
MTLLARLRELKWVLQQTNVRAFLGTVPEGQKHVIRFEDLVGNPEPTLRCLCSAMGITMERAMITAPERRQVMNPALGDPNFHEHDRIEAAKAVHWQRRFSETSLRPETLDLMATIGIPSSVEWGRAGRPIEWGAEALSLPAEMPHGF